MKLDYEFIKQLVDKAARTIEEVEKFKNASGKEKMDRVNDIVYHYFDTWYETIQLNFLVKSFLKNKIRNAIPIMTQKVYDLIAMSIEGITKNN